MILTMMARRNNGGLEDTMAKLKDFCAINPKAPVLTDDLEVSFVPMPKVGEQGEFDPSEIKEYREVKKGFTNFQNGDVLFAKITPCMENGKGAVAKGLKNGYGFGSTEFHVLRPDYSKVTSEWLYYLTRWEEFRKEAEINMTGSAGQKRVPKTFLENYEIKLPEVEKQKEMADVLEHIGNLIALRKEQLAKLDQLVKSRFIELFGDPITNSKNLPTERMELRFSLKAGITTAAEHIHDFEEGKFEVPCYGGNGIRGYVEEKSYSGNYPIIGRQGALCGNVQYATGEFHATEHAVLVSLLKDDNTVWVYHLLKLMDLFRFHTGAAQPGLAVKTLNTVDVLVADRELQNQFAAFVEQTDKSKLAVQQSLDKLELLKKSLMQEYFG